MINNSNGGEVKEGKISDMTMNVEFLAGTSIEQAIRKASDLAFKLDMAYVCFSFNGTKFSVGGTYSAPAFEKAITSYHNGEKYIICN